MAEIILRWAKERSLRRLRSDRLMGFPDEVLTSEWAEILERARIKDEEAIYALLDAARVGADRADCWRNWSFLTLQIQLAAEQHQVPELARTDSFTHRYVEEDASTEWAHIKHAIRTKVGEIPFRNWFDETRQTEQLGDEITVVVPNEPTRVYLESEYAELIERAIANTGLTRVRLIVNPQD
jgi:DnaA N-terminal domain